MKLHETLWGTTLLCPGGGQYVWNEAGQTMESSMYGHPGSPKDPPGVPQQLTAVTAAAFGLTCEHDGLRVQAEHRAPSMPLGPATCRDMSVCRHRLLDQPAWDQTPSGSDAMPPQSPATRGRGHFWITASPPTSSMNPVTRSDSKGEGTSGPPPAHRRPPRKT